MLGRVAAKRRHACCCYSAIDLTVFLISNALSSCTYLSGGWLLISRFIMKTRHSLSDEKKTSNSYKAILPKYSFNNQYLQRKGFNQLKQDMGFTQIRFYCFKKERGRVFHIMTKQDTKGANVVKFFTASNATPVACGSFTRLPDDNSSLAVNCGKWGYPNKNRWGHSSFLTEDRIFKRPFTWAYTRFYQFASGSLYQCDDTSGRPEHVPG